MMSNKLIMVLWYAGVLSVGAVIGDAVEKRHQLKVKRSEERIHSSMLEVSKIYEGLKKYDCKEEEA